MNITTTRTALITRRFGRTSLVAGAASLLVLASACGTETATGDAPASIGRTSVASPWVEPPGDSSEGLLNQRKTRQADDASEPLYLAPSGRPVPLPGQDD
jgi:hypothetical protein